MSYITVDDLRDYMQDPGQLNQASMESAIDAAEIEVNAVCGRVFSADTSTSVQYYFPRDFTCCPTDDIWTTSGLLVDVDITGNGSYSQSWTLNTDFFLEPINQIVGGITGYPYKEIRSTLASKFLPMRQPFFYIRPTVRVTAKFGWAAVPTPVRQATLIIAQKLYKLGQAPFGVAGFDQWGAVRVGNIPEVQNLLGPYMLAQYAVA